MATRDILAINGFCKIFSDNPPGTVPGKCLPWLHACSAGREAGKTSRCHKTDVLTHACMCLFPARVCRLGLIAFKFGRDIMVTRDILAITGLCKILSDNPPGTVPGKCLPWLHACSAGREAGKTSRCHKTDASTHACVCLFPSRVCRLGLNVRCMG